MIFTFDIEPSYGTPNWGRSYGVHVDNERIQKNMEYAYKSEFNKPYNTRMVSDHHEIPGDFIAELTFGNEAWSWLTGCLLGERLSISGYEFAEANDRPWGVHIGYLVSDLDSTSASFVIDEDVAGAFDGVDAVIINDEFIDVDSISSGTVSACTRASEGTTATSHGQKDLVYGVTSNGSRSIVICHRKKQNQFCVNDLSMSVVMDRSGAYFGADGMVVSEMSFNFRTFDPINTHFKMKGADATSEMDLTADSVVDNNELVSLEDIKAYSEHGEASLRQFFIEIHNTMIPAGYGFNGTCQGYYIGKSSTYGVITWIEDLQEHVDMYEQNTKKHYSISCARDNYRMIFAMNNLRINTPSHYYDNTLLIQDSSPWYILTNPVILFQF